ncbi:MAG TPA: hypothetical protein VGL40_15075 [Bacillota bacterium]|jgi:uncharacterized membrane protein
MLKMIGAWSLALNGLLDLLGIIFSVLLFLGLTVYFVVQQIRWQRARNRRVRE